jgi:hypothetical protein
MVGAQARIFGVEMFFANWTGPLNRACVEEEIPAHIVDELRHVRESDLFDGFILYEAAGIMGIDEEGKMHTSDAVAKAIRDVGFREE